MYKDIKTHSSELQGHARRHTLQKSELLFFKHGTA